MIDQIEIPESFPSPGAVAGKRVVITGASRGLGAAAVPRLLPGRRLGGAGRPHRSGTSRRSPATLPGPSLVLSGDVTDEDFNEAVADAAVAEWGGVDAWICNAGISPIVAGPRETDAAVWRQVLEVNLTGRLPRGPGRGAGDGRGRAVDLHRLGPRVSGHARDSPPTAPRRRGWSAWPRASRSTWRRPASR